MGRVYAVASGKGGVGKTTTVANLGAILAAGGHETAVVDADLGMGNLAGALGIDPGDGPTVHDVLAGTASVAEAVREGPDGLTVLPASSDIDAFGDAVPENLERLLGAVDADVVLVDTSAGLSHDSVEPLRVADEVLLVSTAEPPALADTERTREVADRLGTPVAGAVVTRVRDGTDLGAVSERLGVAVRGEIPEDDAVTEAAAAGRVLVSTDPDTPAIRSYRRLAADLTGDAALEPAASAGGDRETARDETGGESGDADETDGGESDDADDTDGGDTEDGDDGEAETDATPSPAAAAAADPRRTPGETESVGERATTPDDHGSGSDPEDRNGSETAATDAADGGVSEADKRDDGETATDERDDDGGRSGFLGWLFG
jgi:septum site-determining protein MinD